MPFPGVTALTSRSGLSGAGGDALQTVNAATFDRMVLKAMGPVAVEFMSYGCIHCRQAEPAVQQVATNLKGRITLFRVNVPVEQALTARYGIQGTPTFVMFQSGREVRRVAGPQPTVDEITAAITGAFGR